MQEKNIAEINNTIISLLKKINRKDQQQNMVSDIEELWKLLKNFGKIFPEDIVNQYSEFFDSFEDFLQNCWFLRREHADDDFFFGFII